jgi:PAS domain S-box-containing protein
MADPGRPQGLNILSVVPMEKEISCVNFRGLLEYLRKHFGEEGIQRVTEGLTGNPTYQLVDRRNPSHRTPVTLEHLLDPANWVTNDFSLRLLANVRKVVPGSSPLYTAGLGTTRENFSRHILFLARLLGPRRISARVAKLNSHFNKTKQVEVIELGRNTAVFRLTYFPPFRVTKDVCEWNRGIYTGAAKLAGAEEVQSEETTCLLDGDPYCTIRLSWKRVGLLQQVYRWLLKAGLEDLVADYEKALKDREQLIESLTESEQRYRTLTDHSLTGIFIYQKGRLAYVNQMLSRISGYSFGELLEREVTDLIHPDSLDALATMVRRVQESPGGAAPQEFLGRRKDGSTLWLEVLVSPVLFRGAPALMGNVIDISWRKKNEAETRLLEERLARSEKMEALGLLAGGVAHDLNNILAGIVSYPDLLLLDLPENSPLRRPLLTIQESGQKSAAIVQDLLTLARRQVPTSEVLNLNRILQEHLHSPEHKKLQTFHPNLQFWVDLENDLPFIEGSPVHLKKTIMNLISNAAEAQPGGGEIEVGTESRCLEQPVQGFEIVPPGEYVVLKVRDKGTGIPKEDMPRIFEPFYTKKVMGRSGTGLGMAVVWGTVRDHKGFIDIESEIGRGALFELYFPITRKEPPGEQAPISLGTLLGHGEKVLVVDDVKGQREIAVSMLTRLGYRAFSVASGEEALRFLKDQPVELLLLDMIMDPGMDGLETYKRILAFSPGQKAVIATGFSETDRVAEARRLGARGYLKKPYTLQKMGIALQEELAQSQPGETRPGF